MTERAKSISVIGAGSADADLYATARAVGSEIARRGAVLVCGGRGGVMEAACRGAVETGGLAVAILPGDDKAGANPYATLVIPTGLGHARNVLVVQSGEAVIALPGEAGTMSEVALALKTGRPVIGLGAWGEVDGVERADTPTEAVALALARAAGRAPEQAG